MSILGGGTQSKPTPPSVALRVQTSVAGKCVPIVYGVMRLTGNLIWYGGFSSSPGGGGKSGGKGGGGGKGGKGGSGSYTYSADILVGICEGPITNIPTYFNGAVQSLLSSVGLNIIYGTYSQSAWSFLTSNFPSQAFPYRGIAAAAAANFALGGSPVLPNLNYEVQSTISGAISGYPDADPSLVIADYLTNENYGIGFPSALLGSLSTYQAMCLAAGLVISDAITSQTAANSYLGDLLDATNSEFVWASGLLTIIPYGDVGTISGNGHSYTAPTSPLFSLDDDDFMKNEGGSTIGVSSYTTDDPIIVTRTPRAQAMNDIQVEYLDRYSTYVDPDTGATTSNAYNPTIAEAMDDAAINTYGLRRAPVKTMHFFAIAPAAVMAANLQLRRQSVIAHYTFTLDQRYIVLDPMDLIELTDTSLGLVSQPVLITEITENSDCSLTFFAEEYLGAAPAIPAYGLQASAGYVANALAAPPTTNAPIVFTPPQRISANQGLQVWIIASGATGWGGCDVWVSGDGTTYLNIGRMVGPCRQGVTTASVASSSDPDTTVSIPVNLTESAGQLLSGTDADADAGNTLCYLDGELIAYSTATLTSQYNYTLGTYIRRGMYNTPISSHASGAAFARLDSQVFQHSIGVDQVGTTMYVKLTAFNNYGGAEVSLADATPYSFTIQPPPPPPNVSAVSSFNNDGIVGLAWTAVDLYALRGYTVGYAPVGTTNWASFTILTSGYSGTSGLFNIPAGSWVFGVKAQDLLGQLSPAAATVNQVVDVGIEYIQSATISAGGSAVTFSVPFSTAPAVSPSVVSASALYATASSITDTGCEVNVFNNGGTSVGGTVTLALSGS